MCLLSLPDWVSLPQLSSINKFPVDVKVISIIVRTDEMCCTSTSWVDYGCKRCWLSLVIGWRLLVTRNSLCPPIPQLFSVIFVVFLFSVISSLSLVISFILFWSPRLDSSTVLLQFKLPSLEARKLIIANFFGKMSSSMKNMANNILAFPLGMLSRGQ